MRKLTPTGTILFLTLGTLAMGPKPSPMPPHTGDQIQDARDDAYRAEVVEPVYDVCNGERESGAHASPCARPQEANIPNPLLSDPGADIVNGGYADHGDHYTVAMMLAGSARSDLSYVVGGTFEEGGCEVFHFVGPTGGFANFFCRDADGGRVFVGRRSAAWTFTNGTTIGAVFRDNAVPHKVGPGSSITGLQAFDCGTDDDCWPEEIIDLARAIPTAGFAVR